jgi:hypothetical protein
MPQMNMFENGEDLPLFSQTAPTARQGEAFAPKPEARQMHIGTCPICEDTGRVRTGDGPHGVKFCACPAGDRAREQHG